MSTARRFQRMLTAVERDEQYATINAYWRDPAPFEAERAVEQAKLNAQIDAAIERAWAARALGGR